MTDLFSDMMSTTQSKVCLVLGPDNETTHKFAIGINSPAQGYVQSALDTILAIRETSSTNYQILVSGASVRGKEVIQDLITGEKLDIKSVAGPPKAFQIQAWNESLVNTKEAMEGWTQSVGDLSSGINVNRLVSDLFQSIEDVR